MLSWNTNWECSCKIYKGIALRMDDDVFGGLEVCGVACRE